jgi:hypothetical protein
MAVIRLYGADIEFFDQTWKPDDVVKIRQTSDNQRNIRNQQDRKEKSHEEDTGYSVRLRVGCRHVDESAGAGGNPKNTYRRSENITWRRCGVA